MTDPIFLYIDLFCGAGGTTTGIVQAELEGKGIAKVIACVNHDPIAIQSHWKNHPEVKHFEEDIRTLDLTELIALVNHYRNLYPDAYVVLWASLECTNFSKAKGGQPRGADSRTLAETLYMHYNRETGKYHTGDSYIQLIDPDFIQIENVVEFMSWGPLDENGKPVSRKNGSDWMRWRNEINSLGYHDEWKELNSANFGAYTSRNRLFGCFAKHDLPIVWPKATHSKTPSKNGMYGDLKKWKPVKDVLNFEDEGQSIFTRKKPLSDKTLERIYAGLIKYVAKGDTSFISKYYSGKPSGKNISIDGPARTVTTIDSQALVKAQFITQYNGGISKSYNESRNTSVDEALRTITTENRFALVQSEFLQHYYGNGFNTSTNEPCPTLTTKERCALVQPKYFIDQQYGNSKPSGIDDVAGTITNNPKLALVKCSQNQSIHQPAGTILPTDKHRLVEVEPFIMPTNYDNQPKSIEEPLQTITANRKHHYLINPSHGGNNHSVEVPCPVIIARQDKAPLYFVQVEAGNVAIAVFDCDSEVMIRIKQFMSIYGLVDIKMRMLRVPELLKIQGFPDQYKLEGNQSEQKKFIGNSVVPQVVKCWVEAMGKKIIYKTKAA